jgi:hypothetical protein
MCITTRIQEKLAKKAALDAEIAKLEQIEVKKSPVLAMLRELFVEISDEVPEELKSVWQEVLFVGQQHNLTVQLIAADELQQWELVQAENEKLKLEVEKWSAAATISELAVKNLRSQLAKYQETKSQQATIWGKDVIVPEAVQAENEKLKQEIEDLEVWRQQEFEALDQAEKALKVLKSQIEEYQATYNPPELTKKESEEVAARVTDFAEEFQQQKTKAQHEVYQDFDAIPALTVWQPWASLIATGAKHIETRTWKTDYRGWLAIHAAKKPVDISEYPGLFDLLPDDSEFPLGAVVAIVHLSDCKEMTQELIAQQSEQEILCGDWQPGRFAWVLDNIQLIDPPVPAKGGQKLWQWVAGGVGAIYEEVSAEPERKSEKTDSSESILTFHGFFKPDTELGEFYGPEDQYEIYRSWAIHFSFPNEGIFSIGLYNLEYKNFWDASTEYIQEIDSTFPKSLADYDAIVQWTRALIDQVENLEAPGQLALPLEFPDSTSVQLDEEVEGEPTEELTELQKLLLGNNDFTFGKLHARVTVRSVFHDEEIPSNSDDEDDSDDPTVDQVEEALFSVVDFNGGEREYYVDAQDLVRSCRKLNINVKVEAEKYALKFQRKRNADKEQQVSEPANHEIDSTFPESLGEYGAIVKWTRTLIDQVENSEVPGQLSLEFPDPTAKKAEEVLLTGDKYDAAVKEELALDDENEPIIITFQGQQWIVEVLNEFVSCITILLQTKTRDEGFTATVTRKDVESNNYSLAKCAEQVLNERLAAQKQPEVDTTQVSNQTTPEPIAKEATIKPENPETETNFETMGYTVRVYPQYAGENNLVGATFRFLNSEHTLIFDRSLLAAEIGDRTWKTCAEDLIQDWKDKEAARLDKIANPHKKPEDDFVELVKISNAVGYLKQRDTGEILAGYVAFANADENGVKTPTFAKARARNWAEYLRKNYQATEEGKNPKWECSEPRQVKRLESDNSKQKFAYELKITGVDLNYLQRLSSLDFSLQPGEQVTKSTVKLPIAAAPRTAVVTVNGCEVASGGLHEMQSRFEIEMENFGSEGRTVIRLMCGSEKVEEYAVSDFQFIESQNFDAENPRYFVLHRPTTKTFNVYLSLVRDSESAWFNSIYPYNGLSSKEAAAADAVWRILKAEQA